MNSKYLDIINQTGGYALQESLKLLSIYGNRFRQRRIARFLEIVDQVASRKPRVKILDVGGRADYWDTLKPLWQDRPVDITIINLESEMGSESHYECVSGDACNLTQFSDNSFDIVHSNSVIEHVGKWSNMVDMANEVRRVAPHHFVQTPNFWFPMEPHFRTLFIHWYSQPKQAAMLVRRPRGFHTVSGYDDAMLRVQGIRLVTRREMAHLFPDSRIEFERIGPLAKSLIAIR